jgi:UDP-N-acetylmuramate--alanine ligase
MYKKSHFHFMGISGIGMSGLADIMIQQGHTVSGCDLHLHEKNVRLLIQNGSQLAEKHNSKICSDPSIDVLVYSTAIVQNNPHHPELLAAQKKGIPLIKRASLLAEIMRTKSSIAVAGAHGKTTTTALLSHIALESKIDPTVIIGGHLQNIQSHVHFGKGEYCIAEADESDRSFLELPKSLSIVNNIDREHLDAYTDLEDIKNTFLQFINTTPFYGLTSLNIDDKNIQALIPQITSKYITYAIDSVADLQAKNISLSPANSTFDLYKNGVKIDTILMPMPGKHNIYNCLGAISIAQEMNIPQDQIKRAIASFLGVDQRFSYRGIIAQKNVEIFEDYGHHPYEIECTLKIAKNRAKNRLIVLFQPQRFSRTKHLWNEFVQVFQEAEIDSVIMTDIYPASEHPLPNISTERLVQEINRIETVYLPFQENFNLIIDYLEKTLKSEDLLLVLGAGKVNQIIPKLISSRFDK